jgi:hypothetical protein
MPSHLLDALFAQTKTPFALVLIAGFTEFPIFPDACLSVLTLNPASLKEDFAPFFRRPFPDRLALAYLPAFASISIRLRRSFVESVHGSPRHPVV